MIENQQINSQKLERAISPELDAILGEKIEVLDHGFIRVIDYMGNDSAIVQAARVSYGQGTKAVNEDRGLIKYLMKHAHTSPFEMCEIKFHIKLPIFIARQWIRHRTANVNECSGRYSILPNEFYIPSSVDIATQSKDNKQGRGENVSPEIAKKIQEIFKNDASLCYEHYEQMINDDNLARELARMNLPLNCYTEWYWKIDLHNLLHFLRLRVHPHAQFEIRAYANIMLDIVKKWCPIAAESFEEYSLESKTFSKSQVALLKDMLQDSKIPSKTSLSKRELQEIADLINQ